MADLAASLFANWQRALEGGLADHTQVLHEWSLDRIPLDDLFFVGVAALEASELPVFFAPAECDELFGEIGEQIDRAAGRFDRVMSDVFFEVLVRLNLLRSSGVQKPPYDTVVKIILEHLGLEHEARAAILSDKALRQALAEPFALKLRHWWRNFSLQFILEPPKLTESAEVDLPPPMPAPPVRRRLPRRAKSIL